MFAVVYKRLENPPNIFSFRLDCRRINFSRYTGSGVVILVIPSEEEQPSGQGARLRLQFMELPGCCAVGPFPFLHLWSHIHAV